MDQNQPDTLGTLVQGFARTVGEHGERLATAEEKIKAAEKYVPDCVRRQQEARDRITERVDALQGEVVDLKKTLPAINANLEELKSSRGRAFEWRVEVLRALVATGVALIMLVGSVVVALPKLEKSVDRAVTTSVTAAVDAAEK